MLNLAAYHQTRTVCLLLRKNVTNKTLRNNCSFLCRPSLLKLSNAQNNDLNVRFLSLWGWGGTKKIDPPVSGEFSTPTPEAPPAQVISSGPDSSLLDDHSGYIHNPLGICDENIVFNILDEPTLASLGLSSWWPSYWMCQLPIEYLHVDCGFDWWSSILIYSLVMRTCLVYFNILGQRNAVKMQKMAPAMAELQAKVEQAKKTNDQEQITRNAMKLQEFMHSTGYISGMLKPMIQVPFVMTAFMGIRKMCDLPVDSMTTGGAYWFTDLTVVDPYHILPIASALTVWAVMEKGSELGTSTSQMTSSMKYIMRGICGISLLIFWFMPNGLMLYASSAGLLSLLVGQSLKIPALRKLCKIPTLTKAEKSKLALSKQSTVGFKEGFNKSIGNLKLASEIAERETLSKREKAEAAFPKTKINEETKPKNKLDE